MLLPLTVPPASPGYGFVDFDSPAAAQKAVAALKSNGVQAQMAKVRIYYRLIWVSDAYRSHSTTSSWLGRKFKSNPCRIK